MVLIFCCIWYKEFRSSHIIIETVVYVRYVLTPLLLFVVAENKYYVWTLGTR